MSKCTQNGTFKSCAIGNTFVRCENITSLFTVTKVQPVMTTSQLKSLKLNEESHIQEINEHNDSWLDKCDACLSLCPFTRIGECFVFLLNYSYDLLTILISIADVTTDIWVIYNYKTQNRNAFFIISLIVMIVAQLSYSIAFVIRFCWNSSVHPRTIFFFYLFCILPLTPVMSFIFFIVSFEGNCITTLLDYLGFVDDWDGADPTRIRPDQAPIVVWIEKKLQKHMGFIMEAMIEALPQSIIQLIVSKIKHSFF